MCSMVKTLEGRLPKFTFVILCLCLGSLFLCEMVDPMGAWVDYRHMNEQGKISDHSNPYDHDDDFVLTEEAAARIRTVSALEKRAAHLSGASQSPSPLLPPPKAA